MTVMKTKCGDDGMSNEGAQYTQLRRDAIRSDADEIQPGAEVMHRTKRAADGEIEN